MEKDQSGKGGVERIGLYALIVAAAALLIVLGTRYRSRAAAKDAAAAAPATPAPTTPPPGDVAQMLAGLEAKLRANPKDGEGWRMLGWSYFQLNRFADAARAYARGAALLPNDAGLWSGLGEALVLAGGAGVSDDAAHAFDRALSIDPKDARARYFLAVRKDLAGDHKGAIEDWIGVLRDAPPDAPYAQSIRALIEQVAARAKIDVSGRLPAVAATPDVRAAIPGPSATDMQDAARLSPSDQAAMAKTMVDRLAARLATNPRDEAGWARLMRARMVLGDKAKAIAARDTALKAFAGDPAVQDRIKVAASELGVS